MRKSIVYKILIASPSDVADERDVIMQSMLAWNSTHSDMYGVYLSPVRWELDATPEMGARPQEIINRQLVDDCDAIVGVFWTRIGTPTGKAASGTIEEIENLQRAAKPVLLYFSEKETIPSKIDPIQYSLLRDYRKRCETEGMIATFRSIGDLRDQLQRHLSKVVIRLLQPSQVDARIGEGNRSEQPGITSEIFREESQVQVEEEIISQPLQSRYSFDDFIVGPTNRLAHACAISVAERPGRLYNPLFIYGGAGLGKTHLLHAIGQHIIQNVSSMRVVYISGETFTYHYITSLKEHRTSEFWRKYRDVDLWLVDDIQFLMGKEHTEEEFLYTYNALYDMGKQIVISSDRAPKDLELCTQLQSKFEGGMLANIMPPDLETRMAIIQSKAEMENMCISNEIIYYIAKLFESNARQLEGALVKLHAYSSLMRVKLTPKMVEMVLGGYFEGDKLQ